MTRVCSLSMRGDDQNKEIYINAGEGIIAHQGGGEILYGEQHVISWRGKQIAKIVIHRGSL